MVGLSVARDNPSLNLNRAKQVEKGAAWVGTPETIAKQLRDYQQVVGGFEIASMQVNFSTIPLKDAERSMRLFAQKVIPSALEGTVLAL